MSEPNTVSSARWLALLLAAMPLPALAQSAGHAEGPRPQLAAGERVEVQLSADLNSDRHADLAYIARAEESRELRVVLSHDSEVELGEEVPQVLPLDPYPLGDGSLSVKRNVLVLEDLTGGTTAISSLRRFRFDPALAAMRTIGIDATLYSRTYAHDGKEVSWNLLTGVLVSRELRLNQGAGDAAYDKVQERRSRRTSPPLRLEDAPDPDTLLGWPGAE
ncbi:MAG: hypothetical protein WA842_13555 [Croceibacterium sp.]